MPTINLHRCTGIVTSVPSDSPDDYIVLKELKEKDFYRKPYNIEVDMLKDLVDILEVPELGQRSAE